MPAPYRRLGRIVKAHGTRGEVSVAARDDLSLSRLEGVDIWIVPPPTSGAIARRITEVRPGPKGWLVRISGVETPAEAHEVVGRHLVARGEELPAESDAESLVGLAVQDGERGFIGTIAEVLETGANDVLIVEGGQFGQVLVPVIDQVMGDIDDDAGILHVTLLEGLIDEDDA